MQKRIVSCVLTQLDGIERSKNMFFIATSSKPNSLDSAFRRAGRIDKEIEINVPSPGDRYEILCSLLTELNISIEERNEATLKELMIADTHGMLASDILLACKDAATVSLLLSDSNALDINNVDVNFEKLHIHDTKDLDEVCMDFDKMNHDKTPLKSTRSLSERSPATTNISMASLKRAFSKVSPSSIRDVALEVPSVFWSDIGGMDELKSSLKEVVEWPVKYSNHFLKLHISPPKGVLLYGPPGCSKTLMAKALATESKMNFLAVRGPELLSKWLGDSEKAVQFLFKRARNSAPCIVFFDEIDALATRRGTSSSDVNDRVLSQLLIEIDGIQSVSTLHDRHNVIVVAATNRPDVLDEALLRPGRFDRKIYVPPPDDQSREQIISMRLKRMQLKGDVEIQTLIDGSSGFSGAEIVAFISEAAILAIDNDEKEVSQCYLLTAMKAILPQITTETIQFYEQIRAKYRISS